jgi:hypothetical protein
VTPQETPEAFVASEANYLVWRQLQSVANSSGMTMKINSSQTSLHGGPKLSRSTRVFRHKFASATPDLLVRKDVFAFDDGLQKAAAWRVHKNPEFMCIRTDDLHLLRRILDAVNTFATARAG